MEKDITLNGLTTTPSSHESPDGDLAAMLNLVNEDSALKPIHQPYKIGELDEGDTLWVHETPDYLHYIKRKSDGTWWWTLDLSATEYDDSGSGGDTPEEDTQNVLVLTATKANFKPANELVSDVYVTLKESSTGKEILLVAFADESTDMVYPMHYVVGVDDMGKDLSSVIKADTSYTYTIEKVVSTDAMSVVLSDQRSETPVEKKYYTISVLSNDTELGTVTGGGTYVEGTIITITASVLSSQSSRYMFEQWTDGSTNASRSIEVTKNATYTAIFSSRYSGARAKIATFESDDETTSVTTEETETTTSEYVWKKMSGILGTAVCDLSYNGNIVVIAMTDQPIQYLVWSDDDGGYRYLGQLPDIEMQFKLTGKLATRRYEEVFTSKESGSGYLDNTSENLIALLGCISEFYRVECEEMNKFVLPFFVRYGIVLYDQTTAKWSAPILMIPNWGSSPVVGTYKSETDKALNASCHAFACDLKFRITDIGNIEKWDGVISKIVIAISAPINKIKMDATWISKYYGLWSQTKQSEYDASSNYGLLDDEKKQLSINISTDSSVDTWIVTPPLYSDGEMQKLVQNAVNFYELKSIKQKQFKISGEWQSAVSTGVNIFNPEVGKEIVVDNLASNMIYASKMLSYNGRLHIANVKEQLTADGFAIGHVIAADDQLIYYRIKEDTKWKGQKYSIYNDWQSGNPAYAKYFFSTDPNAHHATIYVKKLTADGTAYTKTEFDLNEHDLITGAYMYITEELDFDECTEAEAEVEDTTPKIITHSNEIYVSGADNPFIFPSANAVQCGRGAVLNMAVNTETVSEGQFGEAPLYAFTAEETWVLSLADTGVYNTKQVLDNSVCINADGVTGLTNGVVYTTVNGIMVASGKNVTCISNSLRDAVSKYTLPHLGDIMNARDLTDRGDYLPDYTYDEDWLTFLRTCGVAHDKVNERIIVYPEGSDLSFVYSLRSGQWGMMACDITGKIERAGAQWILMPGADNKQIIADLADPQYSTGDNTTPIYDKQFFVTRPIGLKATKGYTIQNDNIVATGATTDDSNTFKRLKSSILRGYFRKGNVASAIYGSRDLFHWNLIWTSANQYLRGFSGTPYKYFIVVGVSSLQEDESINAISFDVEGSMTNQIR